MQFVYGILLIFLLPLTGLAQNTAVSDTVHPRLYLEQSVAESYDVAFDPASESFYVYNSFRNLLMRINKYDQPDTLVLDFPSGSKRFNIDVKQDGSGVYLWDVSGGRVFNYDINRDTLFRTDKSFEQRAFYSHAPALTEDDRIWFMGGYGFFTKKNLLVYYDDDAQEWFEFEVEGMRPPPTVGGYLIPVKEENAFYYFDWLTRFDNETGECIAVYRIDLGERKWESISTFEIPEEFIEDLRESRRTFNSSGTYKYDPVNNLLMLENIMAYDRENDQMIFFDRMKFGDTVFSGTNFYDRKNSQWYFLSFHPTNPPFIDAYAFDYNTLPEAALIRVDPNTWYGQNWILLSSGLTLITLLAIVGYLILSNETETEEQADGDNSKTDKNIMLNVDGDRIDLTAEGTKIPVTDPSEKEMWKLIYSLLKSGQTAISMSDADDRLFGDHVPVSQRSRSRKKLIETVQQKTGFKFLSIKRDDIDKRFKVLTIDPGFFKDIS